MKNKPIPRKAFKSCHDCDKEFGCFRFRYRCDKCQFCYCSLHLKDIVKENGKKVRICELCLENSKNHKTKETVQMVTESDSGFDDFSEVSSVAEVRKNDEQELDTYSKVKNFLNEIQSDQFNFFMKLILKFSAKQCSLLCESASISSTWADRLLRTVEETCKSVCPSVSILDDQMSLNTYVKIFKLKSSEDSCSFLKAGILDKQCAYKRIKKEITNCRVVLLKGTTWFYLDHKRIVSITDIINQEKQYIISLLKTLSDLRPNLILLEKIMPQKLIKKLETLGIGVLMNVHIKRLQQISRITQAKVLSNLFDIDLQDSVGTCKKYEEVRVAGHSLSFFHDDKKAVFTGSVIVQARSPQDLAGVAEVLKKMNVFYRNLLLERNLCWHLGLKSSKNIFKNLHQERLVCNFVSIGLNRLCQNPVVLDIAFYSNEDMSLGKHLVSMFISNHSTCDACLRLEIGKHVFYYISDTARVKFSLEKQENRSNVEIGVFKECLVCENIGSFSYISQSIWEYSFHKFISNFFTDAEVLHNDFSCNHDSLKACRFNFVSQGIRASFEYQENNKFSLLPVNTSISPASLKSSLLAAFYLAKDSVKKLVRYLRENISQSQIDQVQKSVLDEGLLALSVEIESLELSSQDSVFSLEAIRKYYFSQIALYKLRFEGLLHLIQFPEKELKVMTSNDLSLSLIEFPILDNEKMLPSKDFFNLLSGQINLFNKLCQKSIPLYENDPFSILAYTLASVEYSETISEKFASFAEIEEMLEFELYNSDLKSFEFSQTNFDKTEFEDHSFKSEILKLFGPFQKFRIEIFYPKHFFCLISAIFSDFGQFVESLSKSSNSTSFKKLIFSHDYKFILKQVPEEQFLKFLSFAPNYFRHEIKSIFHKMPSTLIRIFGAFKLSQKSQKVKKKFFILQENLSGLPPSLFKSYKLRPEKKGKNAESLQNIEFFNDFCGLPILLNHDSKKIQDAGIWNDSLFLSKNNIMNYSLVVKVNQEDLSVAAGIGDYFDQLTVEKAIENKYKLLLGNDSNNPDVYKELFREEMMKTYFTSQ